MKFKPIKLEGERVVLKKLNVEDAQAVKAMLNDKEVTKYMYRMSYPYQIGHARELIRSSWDMGEGYGLGISLKDSNELIGYIGFHSIGKVDDYKSAGLEYWIGRKHWGKGYAKEAVTAFLEHGFKKMKLQNVHAKVFSPNRASMGLLEKLGFQEKSRSTHHEHCRFENIWMDEICYELPRKRWKK